MPDLRGIPLLPIGSGEIEVDDETGFEPGRRYPLLSVVIDNTTGAVRVVTTDDDHRLRHVAATAVRLYRPMRSPRRAALDSPE